MHPELALLEQRYLELVNAVQAGHMSLDDALATLSGVSAVDGDGAVWAIDPSSGQFTRALPGQAPVAADPNQFQPPLLPPPPTRFDDPSSAWSPGPLPGQIGSAGPAPAQVTFAAGSPSGSDRSLTDRARSLLSGRGRIVVVSVVAVALVGAMLLSREQSGAPSPSGSASPSAGPSSSAAPDPSPSSSQSGDPVAPPAPSKTQQEQIVRIISGADKEALSQFLTVVPDKGQALLSIAPLTGASRLGFVLKPVEVVPAESGAVFVIAVRDGQGDRARYELPLVARGKGWVLSAPVSPQG